MQKSVIAAVVKISYGFKSLKPSSSKNPKNLAHVSMAPFLKATFSRVVELDLTQRWFVHIILGNWRVHSRFPKHLIYISYWITVHSKAACLLGNLIKLINASAFPFIFKWTVLLARLQRHGKWGLIDVCWRESKRWKNDGGLTAWRNE